MARGRGGVPSRAKTYRTTAVTNITFKIGIIEYERVSRSLGLGLGLGLQMYRWDQES